LAKIAIKIEKRGPFLEIFLQSRFRTLLNGISHRPNKGFSEFFLARNFLSVSFPLLREGVSSCLKSVPDEQLSTASFRSSNSELYSGISLYGNNTSRIVLRKSAVKF
jgi:hypothetical protein